MNRQPSDRSTKVGAGTEDIDLKTVSPTGHEEVESQIAAEAKGDTEFPGHREGKPDADRRPEPPDQVQNPKRNRNSRPD